LIKKRENAIGGHKRNYRSEERWPKMGKPASDGPARKELRKRNASGGATECV